MRAKGDKLSKMSKQFAVKLVGGKRQGVPYVTLFLLLLTCLAFGGFLSKGLTLFNDAWDQWMNDAEWYSMFVLTCLALGVFLALFHKSFKNPVSWGWIVLLILLFAGNAVGLFLTPLNETGIGHSYGGDPFDYVWAVEMPMRIRWLFAFGLYCVYFYCFVAVFPKALPGVRWLDYVYWLLVLIGVAAVIYSLVAEWDVYAAFFDKSKPLSGNLNIQSFTSNSNTFAFGLLGGSLLCCYLNSRRHNLIPLILFAVFSVMQIFVGSRTATLLQVFLVFAYPTHRFVHYVKARPGVLIPLYSLFVIAFVTMIILLLVNPFEEGSFLYKVSLRLKADYLSEDISSLSSRITIYNNVIAILNENPLRFVFGVGDQQSLFYFGARTWAEYPAYPLAAYAHNGLLEDLLTGGLVRVAFVIAFVVYFIMKCFGIVAKKNRIAVPCLLGMIVMLGHGLMESTSFLAVDTRGFTLYLIIVLPLLAEAHRENSLSLRKYLKQAEDDAKPTYFSYKGTPVRYGAAVLAILVPVYIAIIGRFPIYAQIGKIDPAYAPVMASMLGIALCLYPLGISYIGASFESFARKLYWTLYTVPFLAAAIVPLLLPFNPVAITIGIAAMGLLVLLAYLPNRKSFEGNAKFIFTRLYFPFVPLVLLGIAIAIAMGFIPAQLFSHQLGLTAAALGVAAALLAYCLPIYRKPLLLTKSKTLHFDCAFTGLTLVHEAHLESKELAYSEKKKPYKGYVPKKTIIFRQRS